MILEGKIGPKFCREQYKVEKEMAGSSLLDFCFFHYNPYFLLERSAV